jgi:beta-lactamase regulating signal transducer with metallopeptidase domain
MFAARAILVSFSVFALVYCALSLAVLLVWRKLRDCAHLFSAQRHADGLFMLRTLPVFLSTLLTATFVVPSFLILEPRSIEEQIGGVPMALALLGFAMVVFGFMKSGLAMQRAARRIKVWTSGARRMERGTPFSLLQMSGDVPAMTVAGIMRPKLLISKTAALLLNEREVHAALNHELAHVRRRDNLRKLLLQFAAFPGMHALEAAWLEATEIAADDSAVSSAGEALELASALIKMSRLVPLLPPAELTTSLVHSPASLVDARVKRLVAWREQSQAPRGYFIWCGICAGAATLSLLFLAYGPLLVRVHAMTEWMVR